MTKIISTTTQTTTTTTVSTTTMGPETLSKEAEKIRNLLKVGISLTDTSGLASTLSPRDFEIRFVSIDKFPLTLYLFTSTMNSSHVFPNFSHKFFPQIFLSLSI